MKKEMPKSKLRLNRETLRMLEESSELGRVAGGFTITCPVNTCEPSGRATCVDSACHC